MGRVKGSLSGSFPTTLSGVQGPGRYQWRERNKEGGVFFILYLQELPLTSPLYFLNRTELLWSVSLASTLVLGGMELTFPTGAHTGLCFALAAGMVLIWHHCSGCRRAVVVQHQGCISNPWPQRPVKWGRARGGEGQLA